ncbi:histidine kinase [Undibacterium cyanobacteriorum]|uniref:Histidine kinase n=1 Tax=Undibacterium cyanobacteriorum TaxID=3073561 RepID=A0ABY9RNA9_9BURK|nr:histidine kinase [Undibacterium sp. 20NA77.5]WMW82363.1 histidine kinase [Undibacterium sp. 20NA77.5]
MMSFFPKEREFWFYHVNASLLIASMTALSAVLWSHHASFNASMSFLWFIPFTLACLSFRWHYKTRAWHQLSMGKLVPLVILYGGLMAFLVMCVLSLLLMPVFWSTLIQEEPAIQSNPRSFITQFIIGGSLQMHITMCIWYVLYISFSTNKRLKEREMSNLQLAASLREAQLSRLNNQLNPHFLFNALNNIRFLIHESTNAADDAIVALSEILRYTLASEKANQIRLESELQIIDKYIAIAKLQFEDRLRFSLLTKGNLDGVMIPPMILQMLVENAVKHGIEQCKDGGEILLQIEAHSEQVKFLVKNSLAIRSSPTPQLHKNMENHSTQIGLTNIKQRLSLLYGSQTNFRAQQNDQCFEVQFAIPRNNA